MTCPTCRQRGGPERGAHATITALVIVIGLAVGACYIALGGRRVLREDFLDA